MHHKKILIMAGGTGGHVFPGLAVAELWRAQQHAVVWLGTLHGLDAKLVPAAHLSFHQIKITGLRGKGLLGYLVAPWKILRAIVQSIKLIRKLKPDVVLSMGGYVAGPGGIAAWLLRKPLVVHEQNAIPGTTNKLLSFFAKQVLTAFPIAFKHHRKMQWVGNPIRKSLLELPVPRLRLAGHSGKLKVLVLGGSQGAQKINQIIPEVLTMLAPNHQPEIWHQTGARHYETTLHGYAQLSQQQNFESRIVPFIDDMTAAYSWADLVICRSGALTVSEIAGVGIASILIPFPYAVDDHQTANAQVLVDVNAAILIQERDLHVEQLKSLIEKFNDDRQQLVTMATQARTLAKPEATQQVVDVCLAAIK